MYVAGLVSLESCDSLAPKCNYENDELIQASSDLLDGVVVKLGDTGARDKDIPWSEIQSASNMTTKLRRPKRSIPGLPPLITIGGDSMDCTRCEVINVMCGIFNLGMQLKLYQFIF